MSIQFHQPVPESELEHEFILAPRRIGSLAYPIHFFQINISEVWKITDVMSSVERGYFLTLLLHSIQNCEQGIRIIDLPRLLRIQKKRVPEILRMFEDHLIYSEDKNVLILAYAIKEINRIRKISQTARANALKKGKETSAGVRRNPFNGSTNNYTNINIDNEQGIVKRSHPLPKRLFT
jgi:hypothetical protein